MNIKIPEVTLVAVDCTDRVLGTINALNICARNIDFGRVKLLSHEKPLALPDFIEYNEIPKISNIDEYNQFMFMDLGDYISTSHCLTVQDHAYILHAELFDPSWLQYDWIGAGWKWMSDSYICHATNEHVRNGNGGFSLRSKRLIDLPKKMGWQLRSEQGWANEDGNCCVYYRPEMLANGIKYAPVEVAARFAYENDIPENSNINAFFGFHRNNPDSRKNR